MAEGWSTIESEPAVFHELIKDFGCTSVQVTPRIWSDLKLECWIPMRCRADTCYHMVQVEELWSLDADSLNALK